ncbi:hypothetical protein Nepgr_024443 [Nepenthes gracilis]|uniref:Uncharacterized protein n=1 Tax=Nepenthes gracilis TaxID=150966 RepID=A0AAD3T493_NEPGR|nr:hypothetical protein Nepgr_024443 [Nepenthes gracilis]
MALRSGASSPRSVEVEENKFIPMDLAVKEADLRGSLLDRVAAIEDRLCQVKQISFPFLHTNNLACIINVFCGFSI